MTLASLNKSLTASLLLALLGPAACGRGDDIIAPTEITDNPSNCLGCGESELPDPGGDGDGDMGGDGDGDIGGDGDGDGDDDKNGLVCADSEFELTAEFDGPCEKAERAIEVNLGNSPEAAVRAIYCQINGAEPSAEVLEAKARDLRVHDHVRRIDIAWSLCEEAGRDCDLNFSDPWACQVDHQDTCDRKGTRDVGAVMMFFSECPTGVNCERYWANNHSLGMTRSHTLLGFDGKPAGVYNPSNAGFWKREFLDARWAGLQFLMLNAYGPDMQSRDNPLRRATEALEDIDGGIGLALMDDTWGWRDGHPAPYNEIPNLDETEASAKLLYEEKWKIFFEEIPEKHWYKHEGRPLIYFYNAGTLKPRSSAPPVLKRMKELFVADFGVEPFVIVDTAFFEDEFAMNAVADGRFTWFSFGDGNPNSYNPSVNTLHEKTVTHAMVRWDAVGRDRPGEQANEGDLIRKGPEHLEQVLSDSVDSDFTVLATWNDLGEGTGINRAYDYYYEEGWLKPDHFMRMIRESQCSQ